MRRKLLLFYLFCVCFFNPVFGQVKFYARLIPDEIGKNESTQLKLTVENGGDIEKIIPPTLKDFVIVSGPNQESSTTIINNVVKKTFSVSYYIQPNKTGTFTIGPATAIVNGTAIKSNSPILHVSDNPNNQSNNNAGGTTPSSPFMRMDQFLDRANPINDNVLKKGESAQEKIQKNMFVVAEVNKTSCVVGEPVIVEYKLYTRLKSESVLTKNPSFNGFSVIDLQRADNTNYSQEKVNGKAYNVYTIRKVQLYPLLPGDIEVEKMELENTVHFIKEEYAKQSQHFLDDFFSDFTETLLPPEAMEDHKITLQSKPAFIHVMPLPQTNKPKNFKGAVGSFSLTASLTKNNFTTDEAAKLIVVLSGEGNLQLITPPTISWPNRIEPYEPKITNDITKLIVPVSGKVTYEYSFVADTAGKYQLPPIAFSFFDPKTSTYKNITTEPLLFTVSKGTSKKNTVTAPENNDEHFFNTLFTHRVWIVIVLAMLILSVLSIWLWKVRKKEVKKESQPATTFIELEKEEKKIYTPQEWLEKLEHCIRSSSDQFYPLLNQGLKKHFAYVLNLAETGLNKKNILDGLRSKNIPSFVLEEARQLLDLVEWQLYAPAVDEQQNKAVLEKTKNLVYAIDKA